MSRLRPTSTDSRAAFCRLPDGLLDSTSLLNNVCYLVIAYFSIAAYGHYESISVQNIYVSRLVTRQHPDEREPEMDKTHKS